MREPSDYSNYRNRRTDVIWLNEALERSYQTIKELSAQLDTAAIMIRQQEKEKMEMKAIISSFFAHKTALVEEARKKLQERDDKIEELSKLNEEQRLKIETLENAFKSIIAQKEQEPKKEEPSLTMSDSTDGSKEILLNIIRKNGEVEGLKNLTELFNEGKTGKVSDSWIQKLVDGLERENKVKVNRTKGKKSIYKVV